MRLPLPPILVCFVLAACDVNEAPPASLIDDIPVVTIGSGSKQDGEYILYVPGEKSLPVAIQVSGSFLAKTASINTEIQVQQDLYIYRQWSSFDGRNWRPSHDLFDARMRAGLMPSGAQVKVQFNRAAVKQ